MDQIRMEQEEYNGFDSQDIEKSQVNLLVNKRNSLKKFNLVLQSKLKKLYNILIVKTYGLPIILIISFVTIILLEFLFPTLSSVEDNYKTTLTTFSLVSAGILAIMFAMLMVVGQLTMRHSPRMFGRIFTKFSLGYLSLFLILVIIPLITLSVSDTLMIVILMLDINLKLFLIKLTFFLNIISLSLLIPYLIYLKNRINPETLLNELSKNFKKETKGLIGSINISSEEKRKKFLESINIMQHLILNAIKNGDYSTCNKGILILSELSNETPSTLMIKEYDQTISISDLIRLKMLDIGLIAIKDTLACSEIVKALRSIEQPVSQKNTLLAFKWIGSEIIREGKEKTAKDIAYSYGAVGKNAIDKFNEKEISETISGLRDFSFQLLDKHPDWKEAILQAIDAFVFLGINATKTICNIDDETNQKMLVGKVRRVVEELKNISNNTYRMGLINISRETCYKLSTVCRESIKVRANTVIWPKNPTIQTILFLSRRAILEYQQIKEKKNDDSECVVATCRSLQMLAHESMNIIALRQIVILILRKLLEIRSQIEQNENDLDLIIKINFLINGIRQRGFKLRLGDLVIDVISDSENTIN